MLTHDIATALALVLASTACAANENHALVAPGTSSHFRFTLETDRPREIWRLWTDASTWPRWDAETEYARLDSVWSKGARGVVKGRGAPEAVFEVTRFDEGERYEISTKLPLGGRLVILREIDRSGELATFTHDVRFEGFGGWVLAPFFGPRYRAALPKVLFELKAAAEGDR